MENLRCIIVDDEEGAHRVLQHYIGEMGVLELCGSFYSAMQAMEFLYKEKVDLIFLDLNMPSLTGFDMLESMSDRPSIILTTAYKEYALEGYKYEVVDYLVKPFDFKKFVSAVYKVFKRNRLTKKTEPIPSERKEAEDLNSMMIKVDGELVKINIDDILYLQSYGNYVKFFTSNGLLLTQITTAELESRLDKSFFARIHKSYIVAKKRVDKIRISEGRLFLEDGTELPVGKTYKKLLMETFQTVLVY